MFMQDMHKFEETLEAITALLEYNSALSIFPWIETIRLSLVQVLAIYFEWCKFQLEKVKNLLVPFYFNNYRNYYKNVHKSVVMKLPKNVKKWLTHLLLEFSF